MTDVAHIVGLDSSQRRERLFRGAELTDDEVNLEEESHGHRHSAGDDDDVQFAELLHPQIEQHDDEEEQHHDRAGINEDLDNADEKGIERDEEGGEAHEADNEAECARDRVAVDDDGGAKNQHEEGEEPEKDRAHTAIADCRLQIADWNRLPPRNLQSEICDLKLDFISSRSISAQRRA